MSDSFTGMLSGGLIDTSQPDYGRLAAHNEKKRQALIRLGTQQINSVFGGGTSPFYSLAGGDGSKFDRKGQYYTLSGKGVVPYWTPGPGGSHPHGTFTPNLIGKSLASGGGDLAAAGIVKGLGIDRLFGDEDSPAEIAAKRFKRGLLLNAPDYQTFEGFQPSFFDKRAKDYVNYALPQVAEQYRSARNAQTFGLSNRGLGDSSVADQARAALEKTSSTAQQNVADTGIQQANQLRTDVEDARQKSIAQLYQTADPAQGFQSAISASANLQRPSTFAPVANMFSNLANQYYINQVLNSYRQSPFQGSPYSLAGSIAPVGGSSY